MTHNHTLNTLILKEIDSVLDKTLQIRRHIHMHPEISGQEFETAAFITARLSELGIPSKSYINNTAVIATLNNGEGPTVVLRADTDALPVSEDTGLPFSSINKGAMHACGHDIHTACLLGATNVLFNLRQYWSGTVVCMFQPQEETEPGGAVELIKCGAFPLNAKAVFGLHVNSDHECGTVGIKKGVDYAGVQAFDITINGKGGHGGTPEKTIDPLQCACQLVLQLQNLVSREKSPFFPAVLTVGSIHAGTRRNIIPEEATMSGTIRSHSMEYFDQLKERLTSMAQATAHSYRCQADITFGNAYPPVNNDPQLCNLFKDALNTLAGKDTCVERLSPTMYAEDFSYYQEKVPGIYVHLGVRPKDKENVPSLHSPHFNPDEKAIPLGITSHVAFAMKMLS